MGKQSGKLEEEAHSNQGGTEMKRSDINDFIRSNQELSRRELGNKCGISENAVKHREKAMGLLRVQHVTPKSDKTGVESRMDDRVIINWSEQTIITHLSEFGTYTCNFTTHGAIQRAYVHSYEGKGETSAEVATQFSFAHSKAVLLYARLHGFTKSSLGQTDIEFEQGLTAEDAADENVQSLKRAAMKKTQKRQWQQTQNDADKWRNFRHSVYHPMRDWIMEYLPSHKSPLLKLPAHKSGDFIGVVGVSDWHYMKLCFDHMGLVNYDRKIAQKALEDANESLITQMLKYGRPNKLFIPTGTDNLHIDYMTQTTTRGTPQAGQTDGDWKQALDKYVDIVISMIELYSQIAPVEVVSMPGNHDAHTSQMLRVLLSAYFKKNPRVNVNECYHSRSYFQYGNSALMFTHGDGISGNRLKTNVHKFFMSEAEEQGVKLSTCKHFFMFSGHIHTDRFTDLGVVKHFTIPSLAGEDKWHKESGYTGNTQESSMYLLDKKLGRRVIVYS